MRKDFFKIFLLCFFVNFSNISFAKFESNIILKVENEIVEGRTVDNAETSIEDIVKGVALEAVQRKINE